MISGLLELVGFDLTASAILLIVAWYGLRAARMASKAGARATSVSWYAIVVVSAFGVAGLLGWAEIRPDVVFRDLGTAVSMAAEWAKDTIVPTVEEALQ